MYTKWTEHLNNKADKENFENQVRSAKDVLDRLKHMLEDREKSLNRTEIDMKTYDSPGWDFRQAHMNGRRAEIYDLKKLVDLDQQKIILL